MTIAQSESILLMKLAIWRRATLITCTVTITTELEGLSLLCITLSQLAIVREVRSFRVTNVYF